VAVLALAVGAYGAGLATWSFLRDEARAERQFVVKDLSVTQVFRRDYGSHGCRIRGRVSITIVNTGSRPVTITGLDVRTNFGYGLSAVSSRQSDRLGTRRPIYVGARMPKRLEESAQVTIFLDLNSAQAAFGPSRIVAIDVTDNTGLIVREPVPASFTEQIEWSAGLAPLSRRVLPCPPGS
jgi:hypothetical protein